jgi:hypothetical protein
MQLALDFSAPQPAYKRGDRVEVFGVHHGANVVRVASNGRVRVTWYDCRDGGFIYRWFNPNEIGKL